MPENPKSKHVIFLGAGASANSGYPLAARLRVLMSYVGNISVHQLFMSIWKRAELEVSRATKISFVGLSMQELLTPALKFLFQRKANNVPIVVVNTDEANFGKTEDVAASPNSPAGKVLQMLTTVWPDYRRLKAVERRITARQDFAEFIKFEMD